MKSRLLSGLVLTAITAIAGVAAAKQPENPGPPPSPPSATYCSITSDGTLADATPSNSTWAPDGLNVADVTLSGDNASDCYGIVEGNLPEAGGFTFMGTNYVFAAKSGDASAGSVIDGIDFSVSATGVNSGIWTLSWADVNGSNPQNLPALFDLVIGLKAGNNYAAYLFDNVLLDDTGSGSGSSAGTFTIAFNNFQGNTNGLSHLNVYARYDSTPTPPTRVPPQSVPEPGTLALLALGLAGLAAARRRPR